VREDGWLSERLGRPCLIVDDSDDPSQVPREGFQQAKVPASAVGRVHALEAAGFRVVDVNVTVRRERGELPAPSGVEVGDALAEDHGPILEIAAHHYDVSRFHLDPAIDADIAARVKRDWTAAVLAGERGERMLAARIDGRPVGFLAVVARDDAHVIDLLAVHADARRSGAGRALVTHLLGASDRPVEAGTQVANVTALQFYGALGFRAVDVRYVLHRHGT
jgi:ribosomal protein S18 acetylase RimI-like enzyme